MSDLGIWLGRVQKCQGVQTKQHQLWKDAIDLYNCTFFDKIFGGFDPERVDVHFANWYISNLIPLVYFRDPYIFVKPRHNQYTGFADVLEQSINYTWGELGLKQQFQKVIQSAFMSPPGWIKVGYTAKIGQDVAKLDQIKQKSLITELKNTIVGKFSKKEDLTPEEQGVLDMNILEESVFASWVSSWNMLMPPGYHLVNQMPYLIEIEDISMVDFKANPQYKDKSQAKSTRELSDKSGEGKKLSTPPYNRSMPTGPDEESQIIRLYHIWDRRDQKRLTISDNGIHFEGKWAYDLDGFPYVPLNFEESLPQPDEANPYPPNCLKPIMPQVIEKSQARTMMVKHRKRAAAFLLVQKGIISEEEIDQMSESDVMQIIQVSNLQAVQPGQLPPMLADVYNVDAINDADLQMATSMGQMMFQAQKGQRTATQAQIGQSGLQLKASARVDKVEDFTVIVARNLCQLMLQFYDRDKIKEITGEEVSEEMWPVPDDPYERKRFIKAELQFNIDAGSAAPPKDETVDRKQLLDLASIVSSIAPERLNKGEFVKQLLKKFKFSKELDKIVISSDEEEKNAAMQETQLMVQTNTPQVVSPNENHEIHIQVHSQAGGNPIVDQHILQHGQMLGLKQGGKIPMLEGAGGQAGISNLPQEGDIRPPMSSTNPEITRQGGTNAGDIYQSVQNQGVGSKSPEQGGVGF